MSTKTKVILATIALLVSFAVGRYTVPEKIRTEKQIVEVEKKTETKESEANRNKHKETKVVEVVKPDGTKETTTTTTEDTQTDKKTNQQDNTQSTNTTTETKEVTFGTQKTTLAFMAGARLSLDAQTPILGAQVYKPVLGPIGIGVWYLTNQTIGASIGLSF